MCSPADPPSEGLRTEAEAGGTCTFDFESRGKDWSCSEAAVEDREAKEGFGALHPEVAHRRPGVARHAQNEVGDDEKASSPGSKIRLVSVRDRG